MREFNERDMVKISYLYYQEERTQEEISRLFGVSRFKISRTLKEAKRKGYVTITINYPRDDLTEEQRELLRAVLVEGPHHSLPYCARG